MKKLSIQVHGSNWTSYQIADAFEIFSGKNDSHTPMLRVYDMDGETQINKAIFKNWDYFTVGDYESDAK